MDGLELVVDERDLHEGRQRTIVEEGFPLTEELRETLDPRFALRPLPPAELRGIAKPVAVFAAERFEAQESAR